VYIIIILSINGPGFQIKCSNYYYSDFEYAIICTYDRVTAAVQPVQSLSVFLLPAGHVVIQQMEFS
jgi:hypothetical protein